MIRAGRLHTLQLRSNKPASHFAAELDFTFKHSHRRCRPPSLDSGDNANTSNELGSQHTIQDADIVTDIEVLRHGRFLNWRKTAAVKFQPPSSIRVLMQQNPQRKATSEKND